MKKNFTIAAHAIVIIAIWVSPFVLPWYVIAIGIVAYYVELMIVGDCILTRMQFSTTKRTTTFYTFVLQKLGFHPNERRMVLISDYVLPWVILGITLLKDFSPII